MKGLIGKKIGMTQIFDESGAALPVTLIEAGPCFVTQIRRPEREGYAAVQLGFAEVHTNRLTGGQLGHLKRNELAPLRFLREFRVGNPAELKEGDRLTVEVFTVGDRVDVVGTSKGKGYQGGVRRHHFKGGPRTHGQSDRLRAPGSRSSTTTPGRVYKGSRGAGHMGDVRVTSQNLRIELVDGERNLIGVRGSVPGPRGAVIVVKEARKA
ncbi:MAG: 50S ribosomal protein L3 [Chloroflexi bacterium RBG_13_68_17]|jgi:large subunit ribosomal protein L3|nr:MAG: 50S ribosomal protein L3 [Chloroflexi bacterium RBG_13_68_17]